MLRYSTWWLEGRLPALNVLRLAAAVLVVLQHTSAEFGLSGFNAAASTVDAVGAFFIISGMLVFRAGATGAGSPGHWWRYAVNRYFRIVPAVVAFAAVTPVISSGVPVAATPSAGMAGYTAPPAVLTIDPIVSVLDQAIDVAREGRRLGTNPYRTRWESHHAPARNVRATLDAFARLTAAR